jgi:hypothetical protein
MVPRHAVSESDTVNVDGVDDGVSTAGGDTTVEGAGAHCQLLLSDADEELALIGTAPLSQILQPLGEIDYQLAHDGWIHFGLVSESEGRVSGVFVTPTKHLQVWAQDREIVASVLRGHGLVERDELAFLASYPVVVEPPEHAPSEFLSAGDLRIALGEEIAPG